MFLSYEGGPMRRVIVSEFVSLDGVMEAPETWTLQFGSEEQQRYKFDELAAADALLLGRTTYGRVRRRLARHDGSIRRTSPGGTQGIRRHDERLPQARRLDDPARAPRVEQLDADRT